ncbi:MAG TPA: nucleoside deaminase [Parafilimonas sp.]|nr:nucleoside deaminase [Parafilimonas sp.]
MKTDYFFLQRCTELATKAAEKGNSAVGAVIVKDNAIISEGEEAVNTRNDITCHAELEAIRLAVKNLTTNNLSGYTLYSTHEPCIMCSYAIRFYRISKIVYLQQADYLGGVSSSMPLLVSDQLPPHWGEAPVLVHFKTEDDH